MLISFKYICSEITSLQLGECEGEWTAWDDRDDPSGNGDYELIHLKSDYEEICQSPSAVQARVTETGS